MIPPRCTIVATLLYLSWVVTGRAEIVCAASPSQAATGAVVAWNKINDTIYMGTETGLYLYKDGGLIKIPGEETGGIFKITKSGSELLIDAANGEFVADGKKIKRTKVDFSPQSSGGESSVSEDRDDDLMSERAVPITPDGSPVHIIEIFYGERYADPPIPLKNAKGSTAIIERMRTNAGELVRTSAGWLWVGAEGVKNIDAPKTGALIFSATMRGDIVFGSEEGLFWLDGDKIKPVPGFDHSQILNAFTQGADLFVGTNRGVFRVSQLSLGLAKVELLNKNQLEGTPDARDMLTHWVIKHDCSSVAQSLNLFVDVVDPKGNLKSHVPSTGFSSLESGVSFQAGISLPSTGLWKLRLVAVDGDKSALVGKQQDIIISQSFSDWLIHNWQLGCEPINRAAILKC